ncbi:beta-1,4-N-acetylgalactosaminyltransferase bre-4-like [Hyposmocoma kahamanoa]|uniref:beta-1,4-N-acetylgalactosaminyltransferase bre-4-like n=1 Tax=Hyposmocoma kahamanoa TaxID=1477025 RepID=UPI000E6D5C0E|nr:beta-1,4-N-acetylgalactosaminyltransferase bre-4-like [Hyposmocoma kahamanoa]
MTPTHYVLINGYSNSYWDWGGEDDDLYIRFTMNNLQIYRARNTTGVYAHTKHTRNKINIYRYIDLDKTKRRYKTDGLNSVAYKLVNITKKKLFTHILADINPYNFPL